MSLGAGLVEVAEDGRMYNTYVVALPDGQVHRHRKIQAFEHDSIAAGGEYCVFDTPHGVRVGVLICYDNNIVENVRITALMGADVLLAPHQTGGCNSVSPHGMKPVDKTISASPQRVGRGDGRVDTRVDGGQGTRLAHAVVAVAGP